MLASDFASWWFLYSFLFFLETKCSKTKKFICPKAACGREYKNKGSLTSHMKYECGLEKQFKCYQCGKSFSRRFQLRKHSLNVHQTIPTYLFWLFSSLDIFKACVAFCVFLIFFYTMFKAKYTSAWCCWIFIPSISLIFFEISYHEKLTA